MTNKKTKDVSARFVVGIIFEIITAIILVKFVVIGYCLIYFQAIDKELFAEGIDFKNVDLYFFFVIVIATFLGTRLIFSKIKKIKRYIKWGSFSDPKLNTELNINNIDSK